MTPSLFNFNNLVAANFETGSVLPPSGFQLGGGTLNTSVSLSYDIIDPYYQQALLLAASAPLGGMSYVFPLPLTPGEALVLSATMKSNSGDPIVVQVLFYNSQNQLCPNQPLVGNPQSVDYNLPATVVSTTSPTWAAYRTTGTVPSTAAYGLLIIYMSGASGGAGEIDSVSVNGLNLNSYYMSLLTSQYQNSPNQKAWLQVNVQLFQDIAACALGMNTDFDIYNAQGIQLDILGIIIGALRAPGVSTTFGNLPQFGFDLNNSLVAGFDIGFWEGVDNSVILSDEQYRILLLAKIAQNNWNGSVDSIYAMWQVLFPGGRLTFIDNQNMTATLILSGVFDPIIQALITGGFIIPRPATVLYNYIFASVPVFGFDLNNPLEIQGFDLGKWS